MAIIQYSLIRTLYPLILRFLFPSRAPIPGSLPLFREPNERLFIRGQSSNDTMNIGSSQWSLHWLVKHGLTESKVC